MKQIFLDSRGVTLAEGLIAALVILVGLTALIATMPLSTSTIAESSLKTTATFLAQQRMEQIKNAIWTATWTSPPACPGVTTPIGCDSVGGAGSNGGAAVSTWPDETAVVSYPRFQRQVRICDCSVAACSTRCGIVATDQVRWVSVTVSFSPVAVPITTENCKASPCEYRGQIYGASPENVELITLIAQRP